MSGHLTPEPSIPSNTEMSDLEEYIEGKLNDPTGQYTRAYAHAKYGNADLRGFSPLQFSPSPPPPEQLSPQFPYQSSSHVLPPAPLHSDQAVRELAPSPSTASRGSTISIPRTSLNQDLAVARVISHNYISSQSGGHIYYDNIADFEEDSSPYSKQAQIHPPFAGQPSISVYEQSAPPSAQVSSRPEFRPQNPTPFEQQRNQHEGFGPLREFVHSNRSHQQEGIEAMNDQGIFVQGGITERPGGSGAPLNPRKRFSQDPHLASAKRGPARSQAAQEAGDEYFNNPAKNLGKSRYSGGQNNWGVNQPPVLVPEDEVTDAALLKRGLARGDGGEVCKRGYGANDPENVAIVNMYETDRLTFAKIAKKLNNDRVKNGREPSLTANAVQTRYNRNAPLLYEVEGREFVPIGQRDKGQRMDDISPPTGKKWTDGLDMDLVKAVKEWERGKWEKVAAIFKGKTGVDMDASECARRYSMI